MSYFKQVTSSAQTSSAHNSTHPPRDARRSFTPTVLVLALASALALPGTASAVTWVGNTDSNWFTGSNWTTGFEPLANETVAIDTVAGETVLVGLPGAVAQTVVVGAVSGNLGALAIQNGGTLTNNAGVIGDVANSPGTVTVDGLGSLWTNNTTLALGAVSGAGGQLMISNSGLVTSGTTNIGQVAGSTGDVVVDSATLTSSASLVVGGGGVGVLTIANGGVVSNIGAGFVGNQSGSTGHVEVNGMGSMWTNQTGLTVGNSGSGQVVIDNGGKVTVGTIATIGNVGSGDLQILGSGTFSSDTGYVGLGIGGSGSVTVNGTGSQWTNTNHLFIGEDGTGQLTISNGGAVSSGGIGALGDLSNGVGTVNVDSGGSWSNAGNLFVGVSGKGTLVITNSGKVDNTDAFMGNSAGAIGLVAIDGSNSTWTTNGNLTIGNFGGGFLTISNGGIVKVTGNVTIAEQANAGGVMLIGAGGGQPPVAPGTLNAATVQFGAGAGILGFNHNSTNYAFDPVISGNGTIFQAAGVTNLTADSSGFTGTTQIQGGRLAVNGSLSSSLVSVISGGTLGGSGTVGGIAAGNGGIVAPGNSIGTLKVKGDIGFTVGSIYQVEVDAAGQSDKINATGIANLDGTVQVLAGAGNYAPTTSYSILNATGGVSGKFADVTSNLAFLTPSLSYDPTNVYLLLTRNSNSFGNAGLTANQIAAGTGAEALGSGNAVYDAVLQLSAAQARNAYDQLSGEVHASARSVLLEDSRFVRDASLERLRGLDGNAVGRAFAAGDGGEDGGDGIGKPARLLPSLRELSYWGRALGSWGHVSGDGNAATVKRDAAGFLLGADTRVGEEGRFGLTGGYSRSAFDVSERNASGTADNYHVGVYGGNRWGELALRTGISYSWHDVSTSRGVVFPGFTDRLQADYKVNTTQAFAELGWRIKTERAELEPFVNLAHVNVASDGFAEHGGAAALTSSGNSSGVTFSTLGLRASTKVAMSGGADVTARGMLGWRQTLGSSTPGATLAFAGGTPFAIAGVPIAKSAAVIEAGLGWRLSPAATLGLSYGGQFGSGLKDQTARLDLNVAF